MHTYTEYISLHYTYRHLATCNLYLYNFYAQIYVCLDGRKMEKCISVLLIEYQYFEVLPSIVLMGI